MCQQSGKGEGKEERRVKRRKRTEEVAVELGRVAHALDRRVHEASVASEHIKEKGKRGRKPNGRVGQSGGRTKATQAAKREEKVKENAQVGKTHQPTLPLPPFNRSVALAPRQDPSDPTHEALLYTRGGLIFPLTTA